MAHFSYLPSAVLVLALSCCGTAAESDKLTAEESATGWKSLFDGETTAGWVGIGSTTFPAKGWSVKEGVLHHEAGAGGGDIVTEKAYLNFEFVWEWRLAKGGNSGVKYNLPNPAKALGFEYQMLDDLGHSDGAKASHQTAALYDLIEPAPDRKTKPVGEWNQSRLLVDGNHVEQWLNGSRTVVFEIGSPELLERVAKSKYSKTKDFGLKTASLILIQDHGGELDVRSAKLRELPAK
jgi:Domain of Unknown Function (DUF1080)